LIHVWDRRVMGYLFHKYVWTINEVTLKSFTKNGIKRFIENVTWLDETQGCCNNKFHSFHWIWGLGCCIHV
jgi:hypothetical protein